MTKAKTTKNVRELNDKYIDLKSIPFFRVFEVKPLSPTSKHRQVRIKIIDHTFPAIVIIPDNLSYKSYPDVARDYLEKRGISIIGESAFSLENKTSYILLSKEFGERLSVNR